MIVVSACLAGQAVRYDGGDCLMKKIGQLVQEKKAITVCPEVLGGLPTPREPAEIVGGTGVDVLDGRAKVIDQLGRDVTSEFLKGAKQALQTVQRLGATVVVLKENSPSCGSQMIYNGMFSGQKIAGQGVTTALLQRHGIRVMNEHDWLASL